MNSQVDPYDQVYGTCANCVDLPVQTGTGAGVDRTVTQTLGMDANGCVTNTLVCNGPPGIQTVIFFYDGNGNDAGVTQGIGPQTAMLTCNQNGEWIMDGFTATISKFGMESRFYKISVLFLTICQVTRVIESCAATATTGTNIDCSTCAQVTPDQPDVTINPLPVVTYTVNNGVCTAVVTCTGFNTDSVVVLSWFFEGANVGVSGSDLMTIGTITRTLMCNGMGNYILTPDGGGTATQPVDQVECVST
ncbi:hypothetical protein FO519_005356 [Halicephalobus sp. NKZ332]|nr:hypothetical protein FO519_005356 [Halicephalobus sp. NKZ332]